MAEPIEVRKHGKSGPEVMVLHGGPGAQGSVASLASSMAMWARVHEPQCRRSGTLPLTMDQHAEDLAAVAPPSAAYIGWSWGRCLV